MRIHGEIRLAAILLLLSGLAQPKIAAGCPSGKGDTGDSLAAPTPASPRNPELAGAISIFLPGMGHVYAGERTKGFVLTGLFVAGIGAVIASDIGQTHESIRGGGWLSVGFLSAVYLYALIDAPFAAERENERANFNPQSFLPPPPSPPCRSPGQSLRTPPTLPDTHPYVAMER